MSINTKVDPETPVKTNNVFVAGATKICHQLVLHIAVIYYNKEINTA